MIGQRFGNYRAVSLLGEGGMGAVYLAEHPEIGRRVAVKVLRPDLIRDPGLLVRFLNEARAANAIRHPNIIEVLDSGTTPEGTPYLVMELLEGEVLSARIRRVTRMPLREVLEFSYQAASALAAAHAKGIVHRDLKPDNLFLVPDPSDPAREMIKVLDFGIAKLQTLPTGAGMQTRTGTLMGTPVYMSPEQCLGTKTVDQRSDIYALGIIMFEMLAGRPPFLSEGFGELVNMHLNVRPPSLHGLNPAVTPPVEALIAKALEKAPESRQRSATELQADIRAAAGKSIMIRGASSPDLLSETMPGSTAGHTRVLPVTSTQSSATSSTTMTSSTGERFLPSGMTTVKTKKGGRGSSFGIGAALLAIVGAGVWFATTRLGPHGDRADRGGAADPGRGRDNGPDPGTSAGTGDQRHAAGTTTDPGNAGRHEVAIVRLTVDSEPSGASITDVASGGELGTTPLVLERTASPQPITVRLAKTGFVVVTRKLDLTHDGHETIALDASPSAATKSTMPGHGSPAGGPKDSAKKEHVPHHHPQAGDDEPAKL